MRTEDRVSALVIQCLIVESFAVAAYRCFQSVADAYAAHLDDGQRWLAAWFPEVAAPMTVEVALQGAPLVRTPPRQASCAAVRRCGAVVPFPAR